MPASAEAAGAAAERGRKRRCRRRCPAACRDDVHGAAQRLFLDEQDGHEGHDADDRGDQEDLRRRVTVGGPHDVADRGRHVLEVHAGPGGSAGGRDPGGGQAFGGQFLDAVGQDGAEHRDADRAADGAEERHGGAGGADVGGPDGVLHGQHEVLHQQAQAEAEDRGVEAGQPEFGGVVDGAGQAQAADQEDGAGDQVALPFAGAADELARQDRADEVAGDHGQRQQAGFGGGGTAGHLEVLAKEGGGAEHADADGHRGEDGQGGGALGDDLERDDGLGHPGFHQHQQGQEQHAAAHHGDGLPGPPVVVVRVAGEGDPDQQQADAGGQQDGAEPVDLRGALDVRESSG